MTNRMNISFDLDGTLIPLQKEFEIEPLPFLSKLLKTDLLRKNTPDLIKKLQHQGHFIHIYTTSYRSLWKIRLMFIRNKGS